jgi:hypothetical protein
VYVHMVNDVAAGMAMMWKVVMTSPPQPICGMAKFRVGTKMGQIQRYTQPL